MANRTLWHGVVALGAAVLCHGCAELRTHLSPTHLDEATEQYLYVDSHSSFPVIARQTFEKVNLTELIDPGNHARNRFTDRWPDDHAPNGQSKRYDLTLAWAREHGGDPDMRRRTRDSVQDKILAASTSRCNVFKTHLRRKQAETNFVFGSLTTVAGVLGAVAGGVTSPRNFAGAAGLFSGLQAEYNQNYYSNLAAHVITQGIELRQKRLTEELVRYREDRGIDAYGLEAAINDAIYIDGNCSVVAGLIEAQESIRQVDNPGLQMAAKAMVSAKALRKISEGDVLSMSQDGSLKLLLASTAAAPSLMVTSTRASGTAPAGDVFRSVRDGPEQLRALIQVQAKDLSNAWQAAVDKLAGDKPTLTGAAVRDSFSKRFGAALNDELSVGGTLTQCFNAVLAPADSYTAAVNRQAMAVDPTQRAAADIDVETASANVRAAVQRVQLLLSVYEAAVRLGGENWRASWAGDKSLKSFDPLTAALPKLKDSSTTALCGQPPKT